MLELIVGFRYEGTVRSTLFSFILPPFDMPGVRVRCEVTLRGVRVDMMPR